MDRRSAIGVLAGIAASTSSAFSQNSRRTDRVLTNFRWPTKISDGRIQKPTLEIDLGAIEAIEVIGKFGMVERITPEELFEALKK